MSSVGFGLLRSVLTTETTLSILTEVGIDETFFQGSEKRAYSFITDFFADYGNYPIPETVSIEIDHPTCFQHLTDEPSEFWVQKVKERRRHNLSNAGLTAIRDKLEEEDIDGAVEKFGNIYSDLKATYTEFRAIDLRDAERDVIQRHNLVQTQRSMPGIPFGFPYLDAVSGGLQPGDSSVIAGLTGSGKTFLALRVALTAWYSGANVLCLCTEMPVEQVARRILAMEATIDTTNLKLGRLSGFGVRRALQIIDSPLFVDGSDRGNFFKLLPGGLYSELNDILLVARELHPDILVIDGASLIRIRGHKAGRWERMIDVMEAVKNFVMAESLTSLSTYHFNKQNPGTTEGIYGGLAMSQLASMVMAFEFERKEDRENSNPIQYRILRLLKGRDGETGKIRVLYNMLRTTIAQDRVLSGYAAIGEGADEVEYVDNDPVAVI